jgi:triosephosphate isomerase
MKTLMKPKTLYDIVPIICVGETQLERKNHETKQVLHDQLTAALANITSEDIDKVVIAYEPVWAISTFQGDIAKPDQVEEAIAYIRRNIYELFGSAVSDRVRVLYGGSVDDQTIASYLNVTGCNGALVGGASLNYERFANLVEAAYRLQTRKKDTA